jgi:hypothetical protein
MLAPLRDVSEATAPTTALLGGLLAAAQKEAVSLAPHSRATRPGPAPPTPALRALMDRFLVSVPAPRSYTKTERERVMHTHTHICT